MLGIKFLAAVHTETLNSEVLRWSSGDSAASAGEDLPRGNPGSETSMCLSVQALSGSLFHCGSQ